jgi:RNA polymerase sigma-70 factor (ECF subfamily)
MERRLLEQAQRGDIQAFAQLFEPLRGKIFAVACRLVGPDDAEDVVMDTFVKAWKSLPGFRGGSSLKTWLFRIASNRARDLLRRRRPTVDATPVDTETRAAWPELTDPTQPGPDELAAENEDGVLLGRALAELPAAHRNALLLRYVDGLSYSEISAATGAAMGTVMSRLFHAKRKLRGAVNRAGWMRTGSGPEGET